MMRRRWMSNHELLIMWALVVIWMTFVVGVVASWHR